MLTDQDVMRLVRQGQRLQAMQTRGASPQGRRTHAGAQGSGLVLKLLILLVCFSAFVGAWVLKRLYPVQTPVAHSTDPGPAKPAASAPTLSAPAAAPANTGPSLAEREAKFQKDLPDLVAQVKQLREEIRLRQVEYTTRAINVRLSYIKEQLNSITGSALLVRPDVRKLQRELATCEADLNALLRAVADADPVTDITVLRHSWSKGGFGVVAEWNVTLKNTSPIMRYSDIAYRTEYAAASGTVVGAGDGKVLDTIKPGQTRTFTINDGFINSQAQKASFEIVGATKKIASPK